MKKKTILILNLALTFGGAQLTNLLGAPDTSEKNPHATDQAAGASIIGSVSNGDGVVTYDGEVVWEGKITKGLRTLADAVAENGVEKEYAAAWDGDVLLWENVTGAGEKLDGADDSETSDGADTNRGDADNPAARRLEEIIGGNPAGNFEEMKKRMEEMLENARYPGGERGRNSNNSTYGESINGKGRVIHNGEEVWKGRINGKLTVAGESIGADEGGIAGHFAAAWDDDNLIWENYPGAGERLKRTFPELEQGLDPKKRKEAARRKK